LRVVSLCSGGEFCDPIANLIKIAIEQRGQGAGHRVDANHLLTCWVRHLAEEPQGQRVAKETGQRGVRCVDLPMSKVEPNRVPYIHTIVGDFYAPSTIREGFILELWLNGADQQDVRVLRKDRLPRSELRLPYPWIFRLVEPIDDHRQPVASALTGGIYSREQELHGLNGLSSSCHSSRKVVERVTRVQVAAMQEHAVGAAARGRSELCGKVRLAAARRGDQRYDAGRERVLDRREQAQRFMTSGDRVRYIEPGLVVPCTQSPGGRGHVASQDARLRAELVAKEVDVPIADRVSNTLECISEERRRLDHTRHAGCERGRHRWCRLRRMDL